MDSTSQASYQILLVDDESNILRALTREIRAIQPTDLDYRRIEVETFESPMEALDRAVIKPFDLVITDYRMPEMNGVRFLESLIQYQPDIARIILSGRADMAGIIDAINNTRIYRFIGKPWEEHELRSALINALRQRDLMLENRRLADLVREQQRQLKLQSQELRRLETEHPGITQVEWDTDGAIRIDESDL